MRKFFARLMARVAVRLNGPTAGACRPTAYLVAAVTCRCGDPACGVPPSVALSVEVGGRAATLLFAPADAADLGRRLVRAGALIEEHHTGDPL